MYIEHDGARPTVHQSAYVAPNAVVSGDVTVGAGCRILFGAVLTAEGGPVVLGDNVIVMEHAVVRGRRGHPCVVEEGCLVGPHAHVNGAHLKSGAFIATGASVFAGAAIGSGAEVRIGGVVHVNTELDDGATVPIGWVAVGSPARMFPPDRHDDIWAVQQTLDFAGTMYGVAKGEPAAQTRTIAGHYVELFASHVDDIVIDVNSD